MNEMRWRKWVEYLEENEMRPPTQRHTPKESSLVSEPPEMHDVTSHLPWPMLPNPCSSQIEMRRSLAKQIEHHLIDK